MPRINLLPWRDELRAERRKQFYMSLGATAFAAGLTLLITNLVFSSFIDNQNDRNRRLKEEIATLDLRIEEIIDLEDKKDRLLARMNIIEQLQRSRPTIVHIFEDLARTLPEGVHLTSVDQDGKQIKVMGSAESNTRVSALMRRLDESDSFTRPDLDVVEVKDTPNGSSGRASQFVVEVQQTNTGESGEGTE